MLWFQSQICWAVIYIRLHVLLSVDKGLQLMYSHSPVFYVHSHHSFHFTLHNLAMFVTKASATLTVTLRITITIAMTR